jgi:hypothetical protein
MATCPIHHREMRDGKYGPFCTAKVGSGDRDYCKYKVTDEPTYSAVGSQPAQFKQDPKEGAGQLMLQELVKISTILSSIDRKLSGPLPMSTVIPVKETKQWSSNEEINPDDIPF